MEHIVAALPMAFDVYVIGVAVAGLLIGIVIGAIPGLNVPLAVAITLPITFNLQPLAGLAMLVGIYKGGTYGGSLSAILINVPGTPSAAATVFDGTPLARQGKAGKALKMALYASVIGELISDLALIFFALPLALVALKFGPAENFALAVFSLSLIAILSEAEMLKGLIAGAFGVFLSTFGVDPLTGDFRLTFGFDQLSAGWNFIALVMGVFAIAEAFSLVEQKIRRHAPAPVKRVRLSDPDHTLTADDWRRSASAIMQTAPIGVAIGALPAIGSATSALVSYGVARSFAKEPERFGRGAIEGIAAAETGCGASTSSSFIPLLTLGIPGDVVTAIMLGAFMVHGLVPGPSLFRDSADFITAFFIIMLLTTLLHLIVARAGMTLFIQSIRLPNEVLFPIVVLLCFTGMYVESNSIFDLYVMLGFGVLGYAMNKFGFPIAPLLIGFILGPLVEIGLRQALITSRGSPMIFLERPVSALFLGLTVTAMIWVGWRKWRTGAKPQEATSEDRAH